MIIGPKKLLELVKKKKLVEKSALVDYIINSDLEVLLTLGAGDIDVFVSQIKEKLLTYNKAKA